MPVWVATECMTFGSLIYLYSLLADKDARKIADNLAIRDPGVLHKWLKALNVLCNHCAHNSRVWNRSTDAGQRHRCMGQFIRDICPPPDKYPNSIRCWK